ncbi:MAG: M12 family metallo-peptidase [Phycisphaerales bacterium JB065]
MRARNIILSTITVAGLCAASVWAAEPIETISPDFQREINNSLAVVDSTVRSINLQNLDRGNLAFSVPIDGVDISIEMWPHDLRSDAYKLIEQREDGSFVEVPASPNITYRGIISEIPDAVVAGSVIDDQLYSMIVLPDGSRFWVEPLSSRFAGIDPSLHAVYSQDDVLPSMGMCAVVEEQIQKAEAQFVEAGRGSGDCGGLCVAEFGADADFEFYQSLGSNSTAVENSITNIMNSVSTLYENQVGIAYEVTGIIVRTAEPDPYSSTNPDVLLPAFRSEWLNNVGNTIPHDIAQLFSGKNFDGSTIGLAYVGTVCTNSKYGIVETTCCGSFSCRTDLTAHEAGHNWGSGHHSGSNSTMNPGLVCANNFITASRNAITNYRNSITCLEPAPPLNGPGTFNLTAPFPGETDVVLNPVLQWSASQDVQFYRISLADNSDFVDPKINEFATSQTQLASLPPNFLEENTDYYWKVTAFNAVGQRSSVPVVSVFTTLGEDPIICDGDANGDLSVDLADLNLVLANFGTDTDEGDVNGDETVDLADLNMVLANFGTVCE